MAWRRGIAPGWRHVPRGAVWRALPSSARWVCSEAAPDVGLGYSAEVQGVSRATLIKAMLAHVDMPQRFTSSITHAAVRAATGPAALDGALWRSLTLTGGETVTEHVYANPADGEIRFVRLEPDEREGPHEVVLEVLRGPPMRIEHYQRDRASLERVHWSASRVEVAATVDATVRLARAAEAEAQDVSFHPKEFPS